MKAALFAYSRQGIHTAGKVREQLDGYEVSMYTVPRFCEGEWQPIVSPASELYADVFARAQVLIFTGALGIAVRSIAPFVRDKQTDPAVLCIDEKGQYVIAVLSGHIGGANELAAELAAKIGAVPVITTATDINHRFSVDAWAAKNRMQIADIRIAKEISAAILEREVALCSDLPIQGSLPAGVYQAEEGDIGICISWQKKQPFGVTLRLIPRNLHLGIGCRKGTSCKQLEEAIDRVLQEHQIDPRSVKGVYSIDLKAQEPGLLQYCESKGLRACFYTAGQMLTLKGDFSESAFVRSVTGVDTVCERAAMMEADRLLVGKTVVNSVTIAIAAENTEVCFE